MVTQFKSDFAATDVNDWGVFRDPPEWHNQNEELTIEVIKPFEEDEVRKSSRDALQEAFGDIEIKIGNIRAKKRGVPYYEADFYEVGIRDERRYFPHDIIQAGRDMSDFQEHLGRVMTEALGYWDYDDVLGTVEDSDTLG